MADIGRSSFIPKEAGGFTPGTVRRKRTFHVFGFIATVLLVGSLILAVGVYVLESAADRDLSEAQQRLSEQKGLFKPEDINEVRQFDRRLQAASLLLQNHIAPLKIFTALQDETKQTVQFTTFTLSHSPSAEVILELEGVTSEFKSIALQELRFGDHQMLKNVLFKEVSLEESEETGERTVNFSLKGVLDSGALRYDGQSSAPSKPTTYIENDRALALEGATPAVLGESITGEDI